MFQSAVLREELQAVAVKRQMARRDHHRTVEITARQNRRLEHRRCRDEVAVVTLRHREPLQNCFRKRLRRHTTVMSDADAEISHCFSRPLCQPRSIGARDIGGDVRRQRLLLLIRRDRRAAHIISILQPVKNLKIIHRLSSVIILLLQLSGISLIAEVSLYFQPLPFRFTEFIFLLSLKKYCHLAGR